MSILRQCVRGSKLTDNEKKNLVYDLYKHFVLRSDEFKMKWDDIERKNHVESKM